VLSPCLGFFWDCSAELHLCRPSPRRKPRRRLLARQGQALKRPSRTYRNSWPSSAVSETRERPRCSIRKSEIWKERLLRPSTNWIACVNKKPCGQMFVEITNYYATNRRPTGSLEPSLFYGKEDADRIQYGKTKITIPSRHKLGELELPTLWKLELSVDAGKHFVLKGVEPLEQGGAFAEIREALNASKSKSLLLFVHGFNVSFETAALRTAQLANDLKFPGLVMLFSWPSDGYTTGYSHDEESVELAGPALNTMLDDLARQSFDEIYLLSHSMGTRLLANVLSARQSKGSDSAKIKEIVFAAPDINSKIFERDLAPTLASMPGVARTIYASSEDLALRASKAIHEYRRIGETAGGVLTFAGFETIDATTASSFRRAWGHSYIFDSPLVIADFADAVVRHKTVARRNLKKAGRPPNAYWLLQ
jgi:esterase/lipase superfamily enzyme